MRAGLISPGRISPYMQVALQKVKQWIIASSPALMHDGSRKGTTSSMPKSVCPPLALPRNPLDFRQPRVETRSRFAIVLD